MIVTNAAIYFKIICKGICDCRISECPL